jgi:nitric oxide reductase subunit B
MMGVYGMLAVGLLLFCLRYLTQPDHWHDRAAMVSFWSLNIGLAWMAFANLFPLGVAQLYHAINTGYWHARSLEFISIPWVRWLEWSRLPGDGLFIVGGALPLLWLCLQAIIHPNPRTIDAEADIARELFTQETVG